MNTRNGADARAKTQTGQPYKLYDAGGLFLLVQPGGGKWWGYKYRFSGREKSLALGVYPEISLSDARELLAQARKTLAAGGDPGQVKQEARRQAVSQSGNSFEAVAREWHGSRLTNWTPKHAANVLREALIKA